MNTKGFRPKVNWKLGPEGHLKVGVINCKKKNDLKVFHIVKHYKKKIGGVYDDDLNILRRHCATVTLSLLSRYRPVACISSADLDSLQLSWESLGTW